MTSFRWLCLCLVFTFGCGAAPDDYRKTLDAAKVAGKDGDEAKALERFAEAIALRPEDPEGYLSRAEYRRREADGLRNRGRSRREHANTVSNRGRESAEIIRDATPGTSTDAMKKTAAKKMLDETNALAQEEHLRADGEFNDATIHAKAVAADIDRIYELRPDYEESSMEDQAKRTRELARWLKGGR